MQREMFVCMSAQACSGNVVNIDTDMNTINTWKDSLISKYIFLMA